MAARPKDPKRKDSIPLQRRLGQHHLVSGSACAPLIEFLRPEGRLVAEIGPGGGVLTERLIAAGARVIAVEVDPAWAFALRSSGGAAAAGIILGDALEFDWGRLPKATLVAGNLPFNIATVLIERVLPHWKRIPRAAFMVQKEVGDRLLALPGSRSYGALTVLTAARARVVRLGAVKRGSFRPPPKVDAVLVGLELCQPPLPEADMVGLADTVRLAFGQRRKQIRNALQRSWGRDRTGRLLVEAGVEPTARAEELSLAEFVRLYDVYAISKGSRVPPGIGPGE